MSTEETVLTQEPKPMVVNQSTFGSAAPVFEQQEVNQEVSDVNTQDAPTTEATVQQTEELSEDTAEWVAPSFIQAETQTETTENNQTQKIEVPDWKAELKKADIKDVLKELGYDDFAVDFLQARQAGVDPYAYLEAKAFDWNKVPDADVVFKTLSEQSPNLESDELQELFNDIYKQGDDYTEDERRRGLIRLKADAYNQRQQKIENQKKFTIPSVNNTQAALTKQEEEEYQKFEQEQQAQYERTQKFINEHEATKKMYESKRVTVNAGEGVNFNFKVDPDVLQSIAFGKNWVRAIAINPQEADESKLIPDVAKVQRLALVASNPNYEKDLVNHGRSLERKAIVEEGQNARRPLGHTPDVGKQTITDIIKNGGVKESTFGG